MSGCGDRQTMGHGETAICGEVYWDSVWMCGRCARLRLREVEAERDKYKAFAESLARQLVEAGLIVDLSRVVPSVEVKVKP